MVCWQCHEPTQGAVCVGCGSLQPPPPKADPFVVLGFPRSFSIEVTAIEDAWRTVSRQVHPDRWAGKPAVFRRMSLQWTASVNEAKRILSDPLSRAWYLATGEPKAPERGGPQPGGDFLETIFELQMMSQADPEAARDTVRALWDKHRAELDDAFAAWESDTGTLDGVGMILAKLQYLTTARAQTGA